MIKIFAGLYPSVYNQLLFKMQIIKLLNPHLLSKTEILFVIFVRGFNLKFSEKYFVKHLEQYGCSLSSLYSECNKERQLCLHAAFFVSMHWAVFIKTSFHFFRNFIWNLILFRIHDKVTVTEAWSLLLQYRYYSTKSRQCK